MIFATRRDRARIARIEEKRAQYAALTASSDGAERERHELMLRRVDRQLQMARTFPLSIWLGCASVLGPLLVWAVLRRHGHPAAGIVVGLVCAALEGAFVLRHRRLAA